LDFQPRAPARIKQIAVVGAGAAGMNFAFNAAERGHRITLYEARNHLGGQLLMARNFPGKTEFDAMLRYFDYGRVLLDGYPVGRRVAHSHAPEAPRREVTLLQCTNGRPRAKLAPATGWIRRDKLNRVGVKMLSGVAYDRIDDLGLHICIDGGAHLLDVDTVIVCAGQEPEQRLLDQLRVTAPGTRIHVIGGADVAVELDAMRAIDQATRLAMTV
jgi:NADPH-dependent 2,4-dienoyl-CoA reductase/sulfur reductase-like enzyme